MQFRKLSPFKICFLALLSLGSSCKQLRSVILSDLPAQTLVYLEDAEGAPFFAIDPSSCPSGNIYFDFSSAYGQHTAKIQQLAGKSTVEIDDTKLTIATPPLLSPSQWQQLCQKVEEQSHRIILEQVPEVKQTFLEMLHVIAPQCNFSFENDTMECQLKWDHQADHSKMVKDLETKLFRYRQRHPYTLARKVALTRKLHSALYFPDVKDELCEIVGLSSPIELPLPMTSTTWQNKVCRDKSTTPETMQQIFLHSLYESYQELDYLLSIFKKTKTGVLTLRIPREAAPSKDFWVRIEPESLDLDQMNTETCFWHPLYHETKPKVIYSNLVVHRQSTSKHSCQEQNPELKTALVKALNSYITYNSCSELEFAISNGRGKILALPKGEYTYSIRQHYGLFAKTLKSEAITKDTSEGVFSWSSRRPYPTIRTF